MNKNGHVLLAMVSSKGDWRFDCPDCKKHLVHGSRIYVVADRSGFMAVLLDDDFWHMCSGNKPCRVPLLAQRGDQALVFCEILVTGLMKESDWNNLTVLALEDLPPEIANEIRKRTKAWFEQLDRLPAEQRKEKS